MLEVAEAIQIVLDHAFPLDPEDGFARVGRVLAEDVVSDLDSPPFDKSLMDGYAVRSGSAEVGRHLAVVAEVPAGSSTRRSVGDGEAIRVLTGAPIPEGADAVVPQEDVQVEGAAVRILRPVSTGQWILPRGREYRQGEVIISSGTVLRPAAVGLLAAVGRTRVRLGRVPRVAILATGSELVDASSIPGEAQIRNSNSPMLAALATEAGAEAYDLGIVPDSRPAMRQRFAEAFAAADLIISSGGVSVGTLDLVPEVLVELGVKICFHRIRMKPGKPLLFGTRGRQLIFGLPGNPVSSLVGFALFVRPALGKMSGCQEAGPRFLKMPLASDLVTKNDRPTYLPGRWDVQEGEVRIQPGQWFGSADLRSMLMADLLITVEAGSVVLQSGALVPVLPLRPWV